jgi:hypothetical protein
MQTVDPKKAIHPLRNTLTQEDWTRIQTAMETEDVDAITDEELDAAHDVLYDAIVAKMQTHEGITTLQ